MKIYFFFRGRQTVEPALIETVPSWNYYRPRTVYHETGFTIGEILRCPE